VAEFLADLAKHFDFFGVLPVAHARSIARFMIDFLGKEWSMVAQIIQLAIYVAVFLGAVWLAVFLCGKFQLPQWVLWIVGAIFLIILLLFVAGEFSSAGPSQFQLFPNRR
jgi:hypothetical protein